MNTPSTSSVDAPEKVSDEEVRLARLSDVDPRKNPAFSPNLYRWLRKNRFMRCFADRYEAHGIEYLGFLDDTGVLVGSRLWGILCNGVAEQKWSFLHLVGHVTHRPLWRDYLLRGRCAIDPAHRENFLGDRFSVDGDRRTCRWCGYVQRLEVFQVSETRRRWVPGESLKSLVAGAAVLLAVGLSSCREVQQACVDPAPHEWTLWVDDGDGTANSFGYVHQRRYCAKCGLVEVEAH